MENIVFDFEKRGFPPMKKKKGTINCTYYLRGRCMLAEDCPYIHGCNPDKMPNCIFYSKGECADKHCIFKHEIDIRSKDECPMFKNGFCKRGTMCLFKHTTKPLCPYGTQLDCDRAKAIGNRAPVGTWPSILNAQNVWRSQSVCEFWHLPDLNVVEPEVFLSGDYIQSQ